MISKPQPQNWLANTYLYTYMPAWQSQAQEAALAAFDPKSGIDANLKTLNALAARLGRDGLAAMARPLDPPGPAADRKSMMITLFYKNRHLISFLETDRHQAKN